MGNYKLIGCVNFSSLNKGGIALTKELVNWHVREKILEVMNLMRKVGVEGRITVNRINPDFIELSGNRTRPTKNNYRACVQVRRNV